MDLTNQIIMITGANSGIGKETARELARQGAIIIMVCRDRDRGQKALEELKLSTRSSKIELFTADMTDLVSIRAMVNEFTRKYDHLNVLINNAGGFFYKRLLTSKGIELTLATNFLGPFYLTKELLPLLERGAPARIINISSNAHKMAKINFSNIMLERGYISIKAYAQAKLLEIMFTYKLARQLDPTKITLNAVHPGEVDTAFGKSDAPWWFKPIVKLQRPFYKTPEEGAKTSIYLASSDEISNQTGGYYMDNHPIKSSKISYDIDKQDEVWVFGEELIKKVLNE